MVPRLYVITIPAHASQEGAALGTRGAVSKHGLHLTVAATKDQSKAQQHLQNLHANDQTYHLRAGRRLNNSCVVPDVPRALWGPMDASRAKWKDIDESRRGADHVMHIAGASPNQEFRLQSREAQIQEIW